MLEASATSPKLASPYFFVMMGITSNCSSIPAAWKIPRLKKFFQIEEKEKACKRNLIIFKRRDLEVIHRPGFFTFRLERLECVA